jgi:glutamine cyclotransferase
MYPTIMSDVAKARIADWHRQADRDRTARAVRATRTKRASHRLSVTVAGLAAAALALPACQGTATAASYRPHHHAAQATVQQAPNGLTVTDVKDLANVKRNLQAAAQQTQRGMTVVDLQDLAKVKRSLLRS